MHRRPDALDRRLIVVDDRVLAWLNATMSLIHVIRRIHPDVPEDDVVAVVLAAFDDPDEPTTA